MPSGKFAQFGFPTIVYGNGGGGGSNCLVDAAEFVGADAGARIQAAIDSLPASGGVIDCRCFTGNQAISSTITINKPVQLLFGATTFAVTSSPGFLFEYVSGNGSILSGSGPEVTKFQAAGGVTPIIRNEAYDVLAENIGIIYTSGDAGNIGIQTRPSASNPDDNVLRPHYDNIVITGSGATGSGMTFKKCYVGTVDRCFIVQFNSGVRFIDDGVASSNAIMLHGSRFHNNNYGLLYDDAGANYIDQCTVEGNFIYGIEVYAGFQLSVVNTYFEQIPSDGALGNVHINGTNDAFTRTYDFTGCVYLGFDGTGPATQGKDVILDAGAFQTLKILGGESNSGITVGAGQPAAVITCAMFGVNTGTVIQERTTDLAFVLNGSAALVYQVQNWSEIDLLSPTIVQNTFTTTLAVSKSSLDSILYANPSANSASNFFGGRITALTESGNVRNFTGAVIGLQSGINHQGTGTLTLGESVNIQFVNSSTGVITAGVGILVAPAVNSGLGTITSYTALQIQESTVAGTNRSLVVDGGLCVFNDGNTSAGKVNFKSSISNNFVWIDSQYDSVSIGAIVSDSLTKLTVNKLTTTTSASSQVGLSVIHQSDPAGASSVNVYGIAVTAGIFVGNGQTHPLLIGINSITQHRGTGALVNAKGVVGDIEVLGTGNITAAKCLESFYNQTGAATVTEAYGVVVNPPQVSAGTLTTWYGLYIGTPTAAGTNYSIFVAGGYSYFGSQVAFATNVGFYNTFPIAQQTITGSQGGNAALADLLTKLAAYGLIVDGTSP